MRHRILFLLLSTAALCFADDTASPAARDAFPATETEAVAAEPDSVAIYEQLIAREDAQSNYRTSQVGIVVGSGLTIGGAVWLHAVWKRHRALKREIDARENTKASSFGEVMDDMAFAMCAGVQSAGDFAEGLVSFSVGLAGVAVFGFSVASYNSRKAHAAKRDEYRNSLERLRRREAEEGQSSAQVLFYPTVDVANAGGGLNLAVLF